MPIPQLIHYCWFGGNEKPEIVLRCIESWKTYMPDYKIIEWNESNYDVLKSAFMSEAYAQKKWAFVSDYARFDILNQHGGIYVDTDVEFLRPIPEEILAYEAFTGYEHAGKVSPGLIFAAVPGFGITQELLQAYNTMHFVVDGNIVYKTVNMVTTEILQQHARLESGTFQVIDGLAIYPSAYFCGYDQDVMEYDIRPETISVHHYAGTWMKKTVKRRIQAVIKKVFGVQAYRKLLMVKRFFVRH